MAADLYQVLGRARRNVSRSQEFNMQGGCSVSGAMGAPCMSPYLILMQLSEAGVTTPISLMKKELFRESQRSHVSRGDPCPCCLVSRSVLSRWKKLNKEKGIRVA